MAADSQVYTKAAVEVNSKLLSEEAKITVKRSTGSQPVKTANKGYSGESAGSGMTEIEVENAVPADGFEFDPGSVMKDLKFCTVTVYAAGKTLSVKGCVYADDFSHAVDSESKLNFSFRGPYADWE
jgi:hypothetical protein